MKVFYRISDNSYPKYKLPGTNKKFCLNNFLDAFDKNLITVIADNCSEETIKYLQDLELNFEEHSLGNAGAIRYCINKAIQEDYGSVYFVEDDYLHRKNSNKIINEGLEIADYVTVYDHPDKYTKVYDYGEVSKVVKTKSSHWRYTVSTVMTFASTSKILQEDLSIWENYTQEFHPEDHSIFTDLNNVGRKLAVSIPGLSFHTDLTFSRMIGELHIEDWAVDIVYDSFKEAFGCLEFSPLESIKKVDGWEKIKMMQGIQNMISINKK